MVKFEEVKDMYRQAIIRAQKLCLHEVSDKLKERLNSLNSNKFQNNTQSTLILKNNEGRLHMYLRNKKLKLNVPYNTKEIFKDYKDFAALHCFKPLRTFPQFVAALKNLHVNMKTHTFSLKTKL